jgi:hypothetical protein
MLCFRRRGVLWLRGALVLISKNAHAKAQRREEVVLSAEGVCQSKVRGSSPV